jgi:hypothetical protein
MFSETIWTEWIAQENKNYVLKNGKPVYQKKGYLHLDHRFWFPDLKDKIKLLLSNKLQTFHVAEKRMQFHSFSPFIKLLLKTPRYRYQFEEGH